MKSEEPPELAPGEGGASQAEMEEEAGEKNLSQNEKDNPDLLPSGWVLVLRTQNGGKCNGKQIKSYYNPSSGSRFYSKKKLFRHLGVPKILIPTTRETRSATSSYSNKASSPANQEKSTIEDTTFDNVLTESDSKSLPKGWITEIRMTKLGNLEYKVHIDPDNGYEFRSMKDAHRYILTGDIRKCILKPQKGNSNEPHTVERDLHFPTSKRLEWQSNGTKRCLFSTIAPDSGVKINTDTGESLPISGAAAVETGISISLPYHNCLDGENSKVDHSPSLQQQNENLPFSAKSESKKQAQSHPTKRGRANKLQPTISKAANRIKKSLRASVKPIEKPLRASKRLAALRNIQMTNSSAARKSHKAKPDAFGQLQEKPATTTLDQPPQLDSAAGSFHKQKKPQSIDLVAANELERNTHTGGASTAQQLQPGSNNEEPYGSTFCSSWSDPCLEFAFKMLTSDIPIFEDTDTVQEYFSQLTSTNNSISSGPTSIGMHPSSR